MKEFLANYVIELLTTTGLISGFGGWFFGKKKNEADVDDVRARTETIEIENEIKLSNYYKELLDDLKPRYDKQFKEFQAACVSKERLMREKMVLLKEEIRMLKAHLAAKDKEIKERDRRIAELEKSK